MNSRVRGRGLTYAVFFMFLTGAVAGCGKGEGTVSGKVTLDGQPVSSGSICFVTLDSEGKVQTSKTAGIDNDGSYRVAGIPEGPVKITIRGKPRGAPPRFLDKAKIQVKTPIRVMEEGVDIPERYGSETTTDLQYTVGRGSQEHNVELKK